MTFFAEASFEKSYRMTVEDFDRLKCIPVTKELVKWEERVLKLVNSVRKKYNLTEFVMKKDLCKHAKDHSRNMAAGKVEFGHAGFDKRAREVFQRGLHCAVGENVAYTYLVEDPLIVSLEGWMNSQGHRDNILGNFDETGIGIAFSEQGRCYITQLFAKTL